VRLIYVTAGFPYPLTSGYLRHYHLLGRLAQDHEIRLFSLVGRDHSPEDRVAVEALGVTVETFDVHSTSWRRYSAKAARLVPRLVAGGAADLRRAVAGCVESGWPDAAIVAGKATSGVLSGLGALPLLVDACDATSMRLESQLQDRAGLDRVLAGLEFRSVRSVERRLHRRADHVIVASKRDGEYLGWSAKTSVVANGVDTAYWSRTSDTRPGDTVIFTGKMSYGPNEDAALRLIDEVWPLVRERRPDARLLVVGTSPGKPLLDLGGRDGVDVTGRVDDMREYLEAATVFAAPIRYGAGIQNKLLEALAMQLPVVASANAAGGLVVDGEDPPVHVTDDLHRMAELIIAELETADRSNAPIGANRTWVADRFDWDVSARRIDGILHGLGVQPPDERNP
jgi:glycosyltransferase involved in cell wall biosynthesis